MLYSQYLLKDMAENFLIFRNRSNVSPSYCLYFRQCKAVYFTASGNRYLLQFHKETWYHILWQLLCQSGPDIRNRNLFICHIISINNIFTLHILSGYNSGINDFFHISQYSFNFSKLNSIASHLYLLVDSAQIFQISALIPSYKVTAAVHHALSKRILNKFLTSQLITIQITGRYSHTSNTQFARHADPTKYIAVHNIVLHIAYRLSNRNHPVVWNSFLSVPTCRTHSNLRRSICIDITLCTTIFHYILSCFRTSGNQNSRFNLQYLTVIIRRQQCYGNLLLPEKCLKILCRSCRPFRHNYKSGTI